MKNKRKKLNRLINKIFTKFEEKTGKKTDYLIKITFF